MLIKQVQKRASLKTFTTFLPPCGGQRYRRQQ